MAFMINHSDKIYLCNVCRPKTENQTKCFWLLNFTGLSLKIFQLQTVLRQVKQKYKFRKKKKKYMILEKILEILKKFFHNIKPSGLVDTDYVQSIINHDYKQIDKCYFAYYTKPPLSDIIKSLETVYDKWKNER